MTKEKTKDNSNEKSSAEHKQEVLENFLTSLGIDCKQAKAGMLTVSLSDLRKVAEEAYRQGKQAECIHTEYKEAWVDKRKEKKEGEEK